MELNVKGLHREDALLAELLTRHRGLRERHRALRAAGGGSHQEKVEFGEHVAAAVAERRARDAEHAVARLGPHAAEVRLGPPVEGCFVNASFLVATAARPGFEASLGRLREELAGSAEVEAYGPLPPYSFVEADDRRLGGAMGLFTELLLLPLAPARFGLWAVDQVVDAAVREHCGPTAVRRELVELSRQLDEGLIGAEEFDRREDELLERLAGGSMRDLQALDLFLAAYEQLAIDKGQGSPVVARVEHDGAGERLEAKG